MFHFKLHHSEKIYLPQVGIFSDLGKVPVRSLPDITVSSNSTAPAMTRTSPLMANTLTINSNVRYDAPSTDAFWIWCNILVFNSAAQIRCINGVITNGSDGFDGASGGGAGAAVSGTGFGGGSDGNNGSNGGGNLGGTGYGQTYMAGIPFTVPDGGDGGPGNSSGPNLGGAGGLGGAGAGGGGGGSAGSVSSTGGGGGPGGRFIGIVCNQILGTSGQIRSVGSNGRYPTSGDLSLRGGPGGGGSAAIFTRKYNNVITTQAFTGPGTATDGSGIIYSIASDDSLSVESFAGNWDYT